ncbi:mucin-binding protein, partial [Lactobacillus sp.]|uniref:mucin-binding protein n=1 Tax=Lactobacillus sp. TaxID=1591 RepID=UPI003EF1314B
MLGKKEKKLNLNEIERVKQRFSIRKYSFGVTSVLLGLSFIFGPASPVKADTTTDTQTAAVTAKANKDTGQSEATTAETATSAAASTATSEATSSTTSTASAETSAASSEASSQASTEKTSTDSTAASEASKTTDTSEEKKTTESTASTASSETSEDTNNVNSNAIVSAAAVASAPATNTESNASAAASDNTSDGASTADSTASCEAKQTSDASTADSSVNTEATTEVKATPALAVANTSATDNNTKVDQTVIQGESLVMSTDKIGNLGNEDNQIVVTVAVTGNAGDVFTLKIPTNTTSKTKSVLYGVNDVTPLPNADTTTTLDSENGYYIITDTLTSSSSINQKITLTPYRNDGFDGTTTDYIIESESIGNREFTMTLTGQDESGNDLGTATATFTQVMNPQMTPSLNRYPATEDMSEILPNTDYTYQLSLKETTGIISDAQWPIQRVIKSINYGTTITIPVPSSFKLNVDATMAKNAFTDQTTITQAGIGKNIVISVPKGSGESQSNGNAPYYLIGQYVVDGTVKETVSADSPITIDQNLNDEQSKKLIGNAQITWVDKINSEAQLGTAKLSIRGAWEGFTLGLHDVANRLSNFYVENASTYDITDAAFTFDMADGFNATGIKTSAIKGTTSYNYELTYADGTTSTGTVAAGDTINANGSSPIRKAVLRPDVFAAKARTGNQYYMTYAMRSNPDDLFYILGTLAEKYDNGTAVKVGDKLTNSMTVTSSMLKTATIAYPQTIVPDQPTGFIASGSYIGRAGETNKYEIVNGSNAEWGTYIIKKPVIYLKLPQYAIFNRAASTIDGDPEITVFAVDNGDAQVIKLDYSKTDYVFDTSKQIFRISVDISDDAIPGLYQGLSFITTDSQMTLIKLAKDDKLYKAEYTEGIVSDKTYISNTTSLRVMQSSEEFTIGATSKGNQDGIFKNKGVSDTTGTDDMTFKLTPKNTTNHSLTNVRIYTNIPSEANVVLTGPVSTDKANVWYATSAVDLTSNTEETGLTWLTADQVTDWSTIKSIKFGMDTFDKTTQANKTSFEIPVKDLSLQGDVGKTLTLGYKTYSDDFVTPIKKAVATSIVITGPVSESKEIKRTINVHLPSGETQTTTQVVTVTRTGQMDETGAVTYGDWTTGSWDEFTAPTVKGYTPSQSSVEAATVDSTMSDVTVDITYTGDAQKARVDYLDEDNSNAVIQSSDELTGLTNEAIPYSTADVIKALQEKGYVLVTDNFPSGATFDDDVAVDQIFTVIFKHGQEDTTRTQNVTQNVTYVVPDGFDKPADSAQTLTFTQTGKKDLVNGTVTWDAVDDQSFVEVVSPTIAGLTPDKTVVDASDVTPDFTGDKTSTVTVTYTADAQKATVVYVDQDNNNVEVANSGELTGVSKGTIVYSTADTIKALEEKGYVLVTDGFPTDSTFDTDSALDQVFTVVLKHGHEATTRTQNVTQNVTYVVPDGFDQPADSTQTLSFTQTGTKDLVTGNIVWDNVDNQSFNAVTSPTIAGLTPDKTVVDASDVTPDFTGDKTSTVTVAYTADAQKATVVYVDQDNNNAEVANSGDLTGTSKSTINYSTVDTIKALEEKGYVLVTDGFPTDATFDTDKNIDQVFMVVLKHGQEASTRTQNVTQTVTYVVPDGFDQPTDSTQTLSFTQTGKKDLVTGTVTWNAVDDQSFAEVVLPTIAGLTPDTTEVAASDVTPDFMGDKTSIVTVTYTADAQKAKVVFIDQDNNNAEVANSGDLTGTSKSTINYSTANTIKALEEKGYVLVTDGFPTDAVFDTDSTVDQVFTVVLKHGQEATTRTQNVTQTVTYVVPDGFDKPADSTQTLSFTQTGTKDLVTGNIVWDNVDSQSFTAVQVPV